MKFSLILEKLFLKNLKNYQKFLSFIKYFIDCTIKHTLKSYSRSHAAIAEAFGVAELYYTIDIELFAC